MDPFFLKPVQPGVKTRFLCVLTLYYNLFVYYMNYTMLLPLLPQYFNAMGGTDWQYLLAVSMGAFAAIVAGFVFGGLVDTGMPMKRLYVLSCVLCMGGNFLYVFDDVFKSKTPWLII